MKQLIKQLVAFSEKKTKAGNITYAAPRQEHDDGVMALLMALFEGKPLLEQGVTTHVGGGIRGNQQQRLIINEVTKDDFF